MAIDDDKNPATPSPDHRESPPLEQVQLRPPQVEARDAILAFLADANPGRGLVQLPTGFGKAMIIADLCSRLIQTRRFRNVLIVADTLMDADSISRTLRHYVTNDDDIHPADRPSGYADQGNVVVTTIQRLVKDMRPKERSYLDTSAKYESFSAIDLVIAYETHRIMQSTFAAFLEGISAPLIGFTVSADERTLDLFGGKLLWKYSFEQAVLDGYNIPPRVYRLNAAAEAVSGGSEGLINGVLAEFRDKLFSDAFPDRRMVPKTLVFANDDAHADAIVDALQRVFNEAPDFATKITSRSGNRREAMDRFQTSRTPRIAVTVSLLATGVDIPALECLVFLRDVKSELLYQQMLARGTSRIDVDSLRAVTPDASRKDFFAVFDAVGVTGDGHFARADRIPRQDHHSLAARRVRVADLVAGGVLSAGAYVRYTSQRTGDVTTAVIRDDGTIALLDGRSFSSPSAAAYALEDRPVNGWNTWLTEQEDATLDQLRQAMLRAAVDDLDKLAQESAILRQATGAGESGIAADQDSGPNGGTTQRVKCLAALRMLRREADAGKPRTLSVRELISLWSARGRDAGLIDLIQTDLANHGLVTVPDFRLVTLEDQVIVGLTTDGNNSPSVPAEPDIPKPPAAETAEPAERRQRPERGLVVGNLPSAMRGVQSIKPSATIEHAITKMLLFDYSQLAVMSGERNLSGAVTWKSIAKARHQKVDAPLSAATIPATEVSYADDLIDALPKLTAHDFFFVRGPRNIISGIVTTTDVVQIYGQMTSPFFLIGEIDQTLRWILEDVVDIEKVQELCDADGTRQIDGFSHLTMGDYQRVLENPEAWASLGWPLDRKLFSQRLKSICDVRNNIMHFNGDPLPDDVLNMLKNFLSLLREYCD